MLSGLFSFPEGPSHSVTSLISGLENWGSAAPAKSVVLELKEAEPLFVIFFSLNLQLDRSSCIELELHYIFDKAYLRGHMQLSRRGTSSSDSTRKGKASALASN